ncbi:hypothetical protein M0Q97_12815, partial [Candidatus Dojkabacteria bacterium]|nr:hypothetical protein [Candidatus Dojkabacteria bacterium]
MKLRKFIATTIREYLNEEVGEYTNKLDYNYKFDKSKLNDFIKNARKWNENDFVEEYVYLNDINLIKDYGRINKGDEIIIGRRVKDANGKNVYRNSVQLYAPYKTIIADKDYGSNHWTFILDNTKELQDEAKLFYRQNKLNKKPQFNKNEKTINGYHASPNKFKQFRYGENKTSGQIGAENGFFFFKDVKFAKYYASVIKDNNDVAYIYECDIKLGNSITEKGENIGTNWGR